MPFDERETVARLMSEVGLGREEAELYLEVLKAGSMPASARKRVARLVDGGMVILSGDNSRFIPVHPRLAIANHYRTWREKMIREMTDRRMKVDRLILELIPLYEEAEKARRR